MRSTLIKDHTQRSVIIVDPQEEKRIIDDIIKQRRLPYSIQLLEVQGDKYKVRNTFGSEIVFIKKGDLYEPME